MSPTPENPACPLCASAAKKRSAQTWKQYTWWDCPDCGVGFVTPFKNPGAAFYHEFSDLYPHEAQEAPVVWSFEYAQCLALYAGRDVSNMKLLDVGCGAGGFLNSAKKLGFQVSGIDFDEGRLKLVREKLDISSLFQGSLPDFAAKNPKERFDVITLFQVLEHLDDPARWLACARALLKPEGRLFIGTPDRERAFDPLKGPGMEEVDNPPNHLTRWSLASLTNYIERNGFRVTQVRSLPWPLPLYALILRNALSFGLATKALQVDQVQHAPAGGGQTPATVGLIRTLVAVKEAAINTAAFLTYPICRLAFRLLDWKGVVLFCVAEPRG